MTQETDARILINRRLREADWNFKDKAEFSTEEATRNGRADYVPKDSRSRPLAVIEAKRFSVDPYSAKDRVCAYRESVPVRYFILSNEQEHYLWDYADGDAPPLLDRSAALPVAYLSDVLAWYLLGCPRGLLAAYGLSQPATPRIGPRGLTCIYAFKMQDEARHYNRLENVLTNGHLATGRGAQLEKKIG